MADTSYDYDNDAPSFEEALDVWESSAFAVAATDTAANTEARAGRIPPRPVTMEVGPEASAALDAPSAADDAHGPLAPLIPLGRIGRVPPKGGFSIHSVQAATGLERHRSPRYRFQCPMHWKSPIAVNPYAEKVERLTLRWFAEIGCSSELIDRVRLYRPGHLAGIPFPLAPSEKTLRGAKYLSLWLLWNDLVREGHRLHMRVLPEHVLLDRPPADLSPLELGWLELLKEFGFARSQKWITDFCKAMATWGEAVLAAAAADRCYRETGDPAGFTERLEYRISTVGMEGLVYLLEDTYDFELPRSFHEHPSTRRLKLLANQIVGLGNDILGFGKDQTESRLNLVSALMSESGLAAESAIADLIQMHNDTIHEYDGQVAALPCWSPATDYYVRRWVKDVRYACIGLSLWAAGTPRYASHKIVVSGKVIEPAFSFLAASSR